MTTTDQEITDQIAPWASRRRRAFALGAVTASALAVLGAATVARTASAGPPVAPTSAAAEPAASHPASVVLPTGERIRLAWTDGQPRVILPSGPGAPVIRTMTAGEHVYAIPLEADRAGAKLDLSLFDVTQLAEHQARIPVSLTLQPATVPGVTITSRSGDHATGYVTPASAPKLGAAARAGRLGGVTAMSLGAGAPAAVTPNFPQFTLDVQVRASKTDPPDFDRLLIINTDDARKYDQAFQITGDDQRVSVPAGHYSVIAWAINAPEQGPALVHCAFLTDLDVTGNGQTAVLDTTRAQADPFTSYSVPRPTQKATVGTVTYAVYDDDGRAAAATGFMRAPKADQQVYTQSMAGGAHGRLTSIDDTSLSGTSRSYDYYLVNVHRNAIVGDDHVRVPAAKLAVVKSHIYGDGRPLGNNDIAFTPDLPYFDFGLVWSSLAATAPGVNTGYLYAPAGTAWREALGEGQNDPDGQSTYGMSTTASAPQAFRSGRRYREDFFRGPLAPGLLSAVDVAGGQFDCEACRTPTTMRIGVSDYLDSGDHINVEPGKLRVEQDGTVLFDGLNTLGYTPATVAVDSGKHTYRLIATRDGAANDGAIRSPESSTEWDFTSSAGAGRTAPANWSCAAPGRCSPLPIMTVHDPLPTDVNGALPTGRSSVVVSIGHVAGAAATKITGLTYAIGVDSGVDGSLTPQTVTALGGGRFRITLDTPDVAPGTGISIHLRATDAAGGTLTQTVQAAYLVSGS